MLYCPIAIIQLLLEGPSLNGKACRAASLSSFPQVPQEVTVQLGAEAKRRNIFLFWPGKSCYRKTPRAVPPAPAAAEKMLQGIVPGQTQVSIFPASRGGRVSRQDAWGLMQRLSPCSQGHHMAGRPRAGQEVCSEG